MLPKLRSPFKIMECKEGKKFISPSGMNLGLRLLTQITYSNGKSNVLIKSSLTKLNSNNQTSSTDPLLHFCFLKTCTLCNKQLAIDKDIYMYRGDQGFCSEECRNRQIYLDEMREEESSNKQMEVSHSHRHSWNDANASSRETRLILEDLRRQRLKSKQSPPSNQNHWAIAS